VRADRPEELDATALLYGVHRLDLLLDRRLPRIQKIWATSLASAWEDTISVSSEAASATIVGESGRLAVTAGRPREEHGIVVRPTRPARRPAHRDFRRQRNGAHGARDPHRFGVGYTEGGGAVSRGLWACKDVYVRKRRAPPPAALDRLGASAYAAYRVTDRGELVRRVHEILDDMASRDDTLTDEEIRTEVEAARKQATVEK